MDNFIAYSAGLFDGEGTVGVYRIKNGRKTISGEKFYWTTRLTITGTYRPVIEKLHSFFKYGSVSLQKKQALQRTPSRTYDPKLCKQCWRWQITNKTNIELFLNQIRPLLMEKAEQVDIVLKFISGELDGPTASKLCKEAKKFEYYGEEIFVEKDFKGSKNPIAKLDESKVKIIKKCLSEGVRQASLAREYGVSKSVINKIAKGDAWSHVIS
jgi:hypothetical protein